MSPGSQYMIDIDAVGADDASEVVQLGAVGVVFGLRFFELGLDEADAGEAGVVEFLQGGVGEGEKGVAVGSARRRGVFVVGHGNGEEWAGSWYRGLGIENWEMVQRGFRAIRLRQRQRRFSCTRLGMLGTKHGFNVRGREG